MRLVAVELDRIWNDIGVHGNRKSNARTVHGTRTISDKLDNAHTEEQISWLAQLFCIQRG